MIQITPQMRILAAIEPVDFRKGIDGLCRLCRRELHTDPFSGAIFDDSVKSKSFGQGSKLKTKADFEDLLDLEC
jgi:transposase